MDSIELQDSISSILAVIDRPGAFVTSGERSCPLFDLAVEGVGAISLPLLPVQAEAIAQVAVRAPYGRGDQTLVDTDVRRVWQVSPERLSMDDASMGPVLDDILAQVRAGLGLPGEIGAELYKLLIYDEGSFFLPHRDTEKTPGMFGTLVLVLPSTFEGGALTVRHNGLEERLSLKPSQGNKLAFAAFYTDCPHEIEPLTQGHRLALVYNLTRRSQPNGVTAPDHAPQVRDIARILKRWGASVKASSKLLCVLEHRYSPAGLSWEGLKGADAGRAVALQQAAATANCICTLAMISISESGGAEYLGSDGRGYGWRGDSSDHDDNNPDHYHELEVFDRYASIGDWVFSDGTAPPLPPMDFLEEEVCPRGALDHAEPDEQYFTEATGNAGASFERTYRFATIALWPRSRHHDILLEAGPRFAVPWLAATVSALGLDDDYETSASQKALTQALINIWPPPRIAAPWKEPGHLRAQMLTVLNASQDPEILRDFLDLLLLPGNYNGTEDAPLLQALALVDVFSTGYTKTFLPALIKAQVGGALPACIALTKRILDGGVDTPMGAIPGMLSALVEGLPTLSQPSLSPVTALRMLPAREDDPAKFSQPHHACSPGDGRPSPVTLAALIQLLIQADVEREVDRAAHHILAYPGAYPLDRSVIPALLLMKKAGEDMGACEALFAAGRAHLTARISLPLAPPADWRREASLKCHCEDCQEAAAFLKDPTASDWSFKARKDFRTHVELELRQAMSDVDCVTINKGSPQTLYCAKNQKSYERRVVQRSEDLTHLKELERAHA